MYAIHCPGISSYTWRGISDRPGIAFTTGLMPMLWLFWKIFDKRWVLIAVFLYVRTLTPNLSPSCLIGPWDEFVLQNLHEEKSTGARDAALVQISATTSDNISSLTVTIPHTTAGTETASSKLWLWQYNSYGSSSPNVLQKVYRAHFSSLSGYQHAWCDELRAKVSWRLQGTRVSHRL